MIWWLNAMERRVITEFIDIYRNEPSLWKVRSVYYSNKDYKANGYRKLVTKLKELYPCADMDMVKKKINALRTNFRKELRKVKQSRERHRLTGEPMYIPSLWYFDQLSFIAEQDNEEELRIAEVSSIDAMEFSDNAAYEEEEISDEFEDEYQLDTKEEPRAVMAIMNDGYQRKQTPSKKSRLNEDAGNSSNANSSDPSSPKTSHDHEVFGRYVAAKLAQMDKTNQVLSERLISEVLYRGQMNLLSKNTYLSSEELPVTVKVEDLEK